MPPQATQPPQQPQASGASQGPQATQAYAAAQQQSQPQPPPQEDQPTVSVITPQRAWSSRMSRRSILRGAAGAGAVGIAAAGGAGAAVALTRSSAQAALTNDAKPAVMAAMPPAMEGPLVVYVSDTTNGVLDVFAGTGQMRLKNRALVSQLLRALK
jgi:hypothetical protein